MDHEKLWEAEREGSIYFQIVKNDSTRENMFLLTGLKTVFQKQLPKMPREYVSRLVYDRKHESIVLCRKPVHIVGGITVRFFPTDRFGEIVFCAISSTEQVKGYGSFLMNYLKHYASSVLGMRYFLTYADNYAVGYFKKMGFSGKITMDRSIWIGKIKDYDGGTLMECKLIEKVNYRELGKMYDIQRQEIDKRIETMTMSHVVRKGLDFGKRTYKPGDIPGVIEAGWTENMSRNKIMPGKPRLYGQLHFILSRVRNHPSSWPFLEPVNTKEVPDYLRVIQQPMDLQTVETKIEDGTYKTLEDFSKDMMLIFGNCRKYNKEQTSYYKCADIVESVFHQLVDDVFK